MTDTKNQNKKHHHGDLKTALIKAGMDLLEEGGVDALTLRKCAARAGVSHAAPAHHFNGLTGLVTAIVTKGYTEFTKSMRDAMALRDDNPHDQLLGCGLGYVAFSEKHPALASIFFYKNACDPSDVEWQTAATESYLVLKEVAAPFSKNEEHAVLIETAIWSMLEGYCNFQRWGMLKAMHPDNDQLNIENLVQTLALEIQS